MSKFVKRDASGSVDLAASLEALTAFKAEDDAKRAQNVQSAISQDDLAQAVNTVLAANPGRVKTPTLLALAAHELGATAETHSTIVAQLHGYVRQQVAAGKLWSVKGAGGGVSAEAPAPKSV
jgi:hypothetical protein